ncbi:hypothetical protein ACJJTC_010059 [Scirpophaga incertulas]
MNLEVSKLSTKNKIEHSKIMSLQHMDSLPPYSNFHDVESSGDETSSRGTPLKRKLSEKDIVILPNGEVKRRKYRRPRKYLQMQLNKSCPLPEETNNGTQIQNENVEVTPSNVHSSNNVKFHGRRLRQRQEKNYYENARRNTNNNASNNNSVKSLQLSPHKGNASATEVDAEQLSALKSSVQSYFRAGQTFRVLARRLVAGAPPAYLIEWDTNTS